MSRLGKGPALEEVGRKGQVKPGKDSYLGGTGGVVVLVMSIEGRVSTDVPAVGKKHAREQSAGGQAGQAEDVLVKTYPQLLKALLNANGGGPGRWPKVMGLGWAALTVEVPLVADKTFVVKDASELESAFQEFQNYCTAA